MQLQPIHKKKTKKRVGRGGKKGTYSGRGIKGQKARAGRKLQPIIRELIKRYPKLRGYRQKSKERIEAEVNLSLLEKKFKSGDKITPKILIERRIIRKIKGRVPEVKILGKGELKKKLIIEDCKVSKSAREKIEKAGGTIK
jgi:large subunit ribosomal protein L15